MKHKCTVCNNVCNICDHNHNNICNNNHNKDQIRNNYWKWLGIILIFGIVLLIIGILGYYLFDEENWVEAIYNASSVLSGVGAADIPVTDSSRIFASIYSLFTQLFYVVMLTAFISITLAEIKFFENQ